MILYNHYFNTADATIEIRAVEVTETAKTYKAVKPCSLLFCRSVIDKSSIDHLLKQNGYYMVSLKPSVEIFKGHLKTHFESNRDYHKDAALLAEGMLRDIERIDPQEVGVIND